MDNESIKRNIQRIRIEHNLSQEGMADVLGVARNTYRNIEKGSTRLISDTVMKVASWSGLSPEEIVLGYQPSEKGSVKLKDVRERYNNQIKMITDDYENRLDGLRKENTLLKELLKEKDDNIRNLKSMVALLGKRGEEDKND
jgi:transcriptional regulator with XRE-family HTH domain